MWTTVVRRLSSCVAERTAPDPVLFPPPFPAVAAAGPVVAPEVPSSGASPAVTPTTARASPGAAAIVRSPCATKRRRDHEPRSRVMVHSGPYAHWIIIHPESGGGPE